MHASSIHLPVSPSRFFRALLVWIGMASQTQGGWQLLRHPVAGAQVCRMWRIEVRRDLALMHMKNSRTVRASLGGLHSSQPQPCSDRFKGLLRLLPRAMLPALQAMGVMHPWVWSRHLRMGATAHGPIDFNDEF